MQTLGLSTNLVMASIKSTSTASVGLLQFELVPDDPRNTVLMMSPSLSYYSFEGEVEFWGRDQKVEKYCGDGLLGYRDDDVRVSHVGGNGGRTSSMASEGCMDKACVKARLPDHQKNKPKKNRQLWCLHVEWTSSLGLET